MQSKIKSSVVAGNLLCYPDGALSQALGDITASLLFAQLTADLKTSRFASPAAWFAEHNTALRALKWTGNGFDGHTFEPDETDNVTIESIIERMLLPDLPDAQVKQMRHTVSCMVGRVQDSAHQLFRRFVAGTPDKSATNGSTPADTSVGLLVSSLDPSGALSGLWISFKTSAQVTEDVWVQSFNGADIQGPLEVRILHRGWNSDEYKTVQPKVQAFLAGRERQLIMPVMCDDRLGPDETQH
jgi:hypothetical protein